MTDDITANFHGGNAQSVAAGESVRRQASRRNARIEIVRFARDRGPAGVTADEVLAALALTHQSGSARFSELRRDGMLIPTGMTRKTRSGEDAEVHVAVTHATAAQIERAQAKRASRRRPSARDVLTKLELRLKADYETADKSWREAIALGRHSDATKTATECEVLQRVRNLVIVEIRRLA